MFAMKALALRFSRLLLSLLFFRARGLSLSPKMQGAGSGAASSSTVLAIPGSQALAIPPSTGRGKLDPRFLAMLAQAKIPDDLCDILGDKDVDTAALFGSMCEDKKEMWKYFKDVLRVDPDANPDHFTLRGRLTMLWESCKTRAEVETKVAVERSIAQLPPQLTLGDYETTVRAYNATLGYELQPHLQPSQPLLEKLLGQAESSFKAPKLTWVSSFAQQEVLMPRDQGMQWDQRTCSFKNTSKEFEVPMPANSEELETRLKVLAHGYAMTKLRFASHPKLSTAETHVFTRYWEYLKGKDVWGFVVKGANGLPVSCPHIGHVMDFDYALREKQAQLMNVSMDFQAALERALADSDLRLLRFTSVFTCDVTSPECRALSCPGLSDRFPLMSKGQKRPAPATSTQDGAGAAANTTTLTASAKKRAKQLRRAEAKAKAAAQQVHQQQQQQQRRNGAGPGGKAGGKGGKRGGGGGGNNAAGMPMGGGGRDLPAGAKERSSDGRLICYAYSRGQCTRGDSCRFAHICWWCEGSHPGGQQRRCPPPGGG